MKALYTICPDPDSAQRMVNALRDASSDLGFDRSRIVVISDEPYEEFDFSREHAKSHMFPLAAIGGICGGFVGYFLTTLSQHSYPLNTGGMPIAPTWTNGIIVYELTMLGAIVTTLVTLLITAGLPNFKAPLTDPEIWTGKILVGVKDPPPSAGNELRNRFLRAGASQVKEFQN